MKILLGIPTGGAPTAPFLASVKGLRLPAGASAFGTHLVSGNFVPAQREAIVERALETNADILLMMDDDMDVPADAVADLCDALFSDPRCGLTGALYYSRDGFRPMVVDEWDPADTTRATVPAFDRLPVPVAGVGFGCVALRMDAVRELAPPYFSAHVYIERHAQRVRLCDEDYLFCYRLRENGWTVLLHPGVRCGHYDRASGITYPTAWEDASTTSVARMAVMRDGQPALVPVKGEAARTAEHHRRVEIEYVVVD